MVVKNRTTLGASTKNPTPTTASRIIRGAVSTKIVRPPLHSAVRRAVRCAFPRQVPLPDRVGDSAESGRVEADGEAKGRRRQQNLQAEVAHRPPTAGVGQNRGQRTDGSRSAPMDRTGAGSRKIQQYRGQRPLEMTSRPGDQQTEGQQRQPDVDDGQPNPDRQERDGDDQEGDCRHEIDDRVQQLGPRCPGEDTFPAPDHHRRRGFGPGVNGPPFAEGATGPLGFGRYCRRLRIHRSIVALPHHRPKGPARPTSGGLGPLSSSTTAGARPVEPLVV